MRKIMALMRESDFRTAQAEVDSFLAKETSPEIRSEALSVRAYLKGEVGDLQAALEDLLNARSLIGADYARYVDEISIGVISEKLGRSGEAVYWYQVALRTCVDGEGISGGTALRRLLQLLPQEDLSPDDKALCDSAAQKSWQVLKLAGRPDLTDLTQVISAIKEGEGKPPK